MLKEYLFSNSGKNFFAGNFLRNFIIFQTAVFAACLSPQQEKHTSLLFITTNAESLRGKAVTTRGVMTHLNRSLHVVEAGSFTDCVINDRYLIEDNLPGPSFMEVLVTERLTNSVCENAIREQLNGQNIQLSGVVLAEMADTPGFSLAYYYIKADRLKIEFLN